MKLRLWAFLPLLAVCTVFCSAQTKEKILLQFNGLNGANPFAQLLRDSAGNFYGTTVNGGKFRHGSVFKLDAAGKETVLHSFTGGKDGAYPYGALIRDSLGNLYGTASAGGGTTACNPQPGCGVVFKLAPNGIFYVLYRFQGNTDGFTPEGTLLMKNGTLYGTTAGGGTYGVGTLFKLRNGIETILINFNGANGGNPIAGVILGSDGMFYGAAGTGGSGQCMGGCGLIYRSDANGNETILHDFSGIAPDGVIPSSLPIFDKQGNLYGVTWAGGKYGYGTVYKLNPSHQETILYSFHGGLDGGNPQAGVIFGNNGWLYGATQTGGYGVGVVYKLNTSGQEVVLHRFVSSDGNSPLGTLIMDSTGNLFGTTFYGGANNDGIVFELTP